MKINKVFKVCKDRKYARILEFENGIQWLGDGSAFYPLANMPNIQEEHIYTLFEIPERKKDDYIISVENTPMVIFDDIDNDEIPIKDDTLSIRIGDRHLKPLYTDTGLIMLDETYLKPLSDYPELSYFKRMAENGQEVIAIKAGIFLVAMIMPYNGIDADLVRKMETLTAYMKATLANMEAADMEEENDE